MSFRIITDSDSPIIVAGDSGIDYQRTDASPLLFQIPGNRPVNEVITIQNSSSENVSVNLHISSSVFYDDTLGYQFTFVVPASATKTLTYQGFAVWIIA